MMDPGRPGGGQMSIDEAEIRSGDIEELARTVSDEDKRALIRAVPSTFDTVFTWDYEKGQRPALNKLYEKAKTST